MPSDYFDVKEETESEVPAPVEAAEEVAEQEPIKPSVIAEQSNPDLD